MKEFEQMMAEINVPEEIATQISESANNGEILAVWEKLAPAVDKTLKNVSTAAGVCAIGMMLAYVADQLSRNVVFGVSSEDVGENVHPNFCIMAIALLAVNTLKASKTALKAANDGDGDGKENEKEKGQEKGSKKESGSNAGQAERD